MININTKCLLETIMFRDQRSLWKNKRIFPSPLSARYNKLDKYLMSHILIITFTNNNVKIDDIRDCRSKR
jgi:hypothetical protein